MFNNREFEPTVPSIGGNVADFLGTLDERVTGNPHESMDPYGNRFAGQTIEEMVNDFTSVFPRDLDILGQRLDDFCGVLTGEKKPDELHPVYNEARQVIEERLQQMRENNRTSQT